MCAGRLYWPALVLKGSYPLFNIQHAINYGAGLKSISPIIPEDEQHHLKKLRALSPEQVAEITNAIETDRLIRSFKTHREHIRHVQKITADKGNSQRCPKCGIEMYLRETKKSENAGKQFWGCSTFPKCRTVRNVNESMNH